MYSFPLFSLQQPFLATIQLKALALFAHVQGMFRSLNESVERLGVEL